MSPPEPPSPAPTPPSSSADTPGLPPPRVSRLSGMFDSVRHVGRDVVSVALGRLFESQEKSPLAPPEAGEASPAAPDAAKRVGVLHAVAQQLRGAADTYVAAKLDEIEARVDEKLDTIEARIDRKIVELHEQLVEMRDRELRHRLRLLKVTLIFTALVAVLSLVYKWVSQFWQLP